MSISFYIHRDCGDRKSDPHEVFRNLTRPINGTKDDWVENILTAKYNIVDVQGKLYTTFKHKTWVDEVANEVEPYIMCDIKEYLADPEGLEFLFYRSGKFVYIKLLKTWKKYFTRYVDVYIAYYSI